MTNSHIHSSYQSLWDKHHSSELSMLLERGFVYQYDEDETSCDLLFMGTNPAFNEKDSAWKDSYARPIETDEKHLPYFKSFVLIERELRNEYNWKGQWTHLDVFAFRETNQKTIETALLKDEKSIAFLYDQLMLARERILHIKPRVIVVSNALVRMFMGKQRFESNGQEYGVWMDFKFEFDREIGTDVITEPQELKGTHVFFTSMLSGQRALDNGSKERLVWHIARALK